MTPPYSSLPNTRPRISSPLTYELTFNNSNNNNHHAHLLEQQQEPTAQEETTYSAKSLALYSLIDALLFINLARTLTPYIQPHLTQLLTTTTSTTTSASFSELSYLIPILALLKALSGLCLLYTGSRLLSYSARCLLLYTLLSGSLYLSSYEQHSPSRSSSLAIATLTLLLGSIVICLPLLRLTHLLLELEDQQQALHPARHSSNHLPTKSTHTHPRKSSASSFRQSNKLLPQARYQHLMNPF
ncbi:hypothetical protein PGT21_033977 [Puccinia graminis f. sp. tritici]|uniref:Uncharacterized protein n=1 Tax=Puccinia graminis f. sp. tritici TaxID=56615 RepID=A0A5B0QPV9_PUCGR|nr:hypothetical protein PGT21_033977 [Puccinia graminis f. sp. tritici]